MLHGHAWAACMLCAARLSPPSALPPACAAPCALVCPACTHAAHLTRAPLHSAALAHARAHPPPAPQLAQTKAAEIEGLLRRLSDVNDEMGAATGGVADSRSHTLARHRDILQEFNQVGARGGAGGSTTGGARGALQPRQGGAGGQRWLMQQVVWCRATACLATGAAPGWE